MDSYSVNTDVRFQSTRSAWSATTTALWYITNMIFQSTRSAWSATQEFGDGYDIYTISIHALRMERDATISNSSTSNMVFQSTRSAWSATAIDSRPLLMVKFQSTRSAWSATAPPVGVPETNRFQSTRSAWSATRASGAPTGRMAISIHALRMERDFFWIKNIVPEQDFNPRAPHGARQ